MLDGSGKKAWHWKSALASRFPPYLCWATAAVALRSAGDSCYRSVGEPTLDRRWQQRLLNVAKCSVEAVSEPDCPSSVVDDCGPAVDYALEKPGDRGRRAAWCSRYRDVCGSGRCERHGAALVARAGQPVDHARCNVEPASLQSHVLNRQTRLQWPRRRSRGRDAESVPCREGTHEDAMLRACRAEKALTRTRC